MLGHGRLGSSRGGTRVQAVGHGGCVAMEESIGLDYRISYLLFESYQ